MSPLTCSVVTASEFPFSVFRYVQEKQTDTAKHMTMFYPQNNHKASLDIIASLFNHNWFQVPKLALVPLQVTSPYPNPKLQHTNNSKSN